MHVETSTQLPLLLRRPRDQVAPIVSQEDTPEIRESAIDIGKQKLGAMIGVNVRLGVNCSVMPGVKIGKNSFIGAGVVLERDLGENKFCRIVQKQSVVTNNKLLKSRDFRKVQKRILEKI